MRLIIFICYNEIMRTRVRVTEKISNNTRIIRNYDNLGDYYLSSMIKDIRIIKIKFIVFTLLFPINLVIFGFKTLVLLFRLAILLIKIVFWLILSLIQLILELILKIIKRNR